MKTNNLKIEDYAMVNYGNGNGTVESVLCLEEKVENCLKYFSERMGFKNVEVATRLSCEDFEILKDKDLIF